MIEGRSGIIGPNLQRQPTGFDVILYEHPFNERVRTYLRLEYLFRRFEALLQRDHPTDHHFCFSTVFEIVEVGGRADLKSDVLKDLERHKQQFQSYRGNPSVAEAVLETFLKNIDDCFEGINTSGSRISQFVSDNEWLASLRNRMAIPGGTCGFDMPSYHAWQQRPSQERREDILRWTEPLQPLYASVNLLLRLLRDTASAQKVMAPAGVFQQNLPQGKFQMMRLRMDPSFKVVPEISGNRMMVSVRLMRQDAQGHLVPVADDVPFEMALCT
jgi:cell division protein ZapD